MTVKPLDHIDHAIVAKPHPSKYLMHKYWARKPHNVVSEYIQHYTQEGDIVLDLFSGSGVTAVESLILNRRAIACDLDPMAIFITRCTTTPIEMAGFKSTFKRIENKVKATIDDLYATTCSNCGEAATIEATIWNDGHPQQIRYRCACNKGRASLWKDVDELDREKVAYINSLNIPYWYPKNELIWNSRVNVHKGEKVSDLFTKRNLYALSCIYDAISSLKNAQIREQMQFCFTASLGQASKLVFVYREKLAGIAMLVGGPLGDSGCHQNTLR
jgi:hypothetical protein